VDIKFAKFSLLSNSESWRHPYINTKRGVTNPKF
jgi:hypothetical protein